MQEAHNQLLQAIRTVRRQYNAANRERRQTPSISRRDVDAVCRIYHAQLVVFVPLQRLLRNYLQPNQSAGSRLRWAARYAKRYQALAKELAVQLSNRRVRPDFPDFLDIPLCVPDEKGLLQVGKALQQTWFDLEAELSARHRRRQAVHKELTQSLTPAQLTLLKELNELSPYMSLRDLTR